MVSKVGGDAVKRIGGGIRKFSPPRVFYFLENMEIWCNNNHWCPFFEQLFLFLWIYLFVLIYIINIEYLTFKSQKIYVLNKTLNLH